MTKTNGPNIHVADLPRRAVGEIVIISTTPTTSTGMIVFALEDVHVGDAVELDEQPINFCSSKNLSRGGQAFPVVLLGLDSFWRASRQAPAPLKRRRARDVLYLMKKLEGDFSLLQPILPEEYNVKVAWDLRSRNQQDDRHNREFHRISPHPFAL